jgi:hypothetical protein
LVRQPGLIGKSRAGAMGKKLSSVRESKALHITVAVAPSSRFDLDSDLNMLKAALLYADEVKLCSFSSSALVWMQNLQNADTIEVMDSFVRFYQSLNNQALRVKAAPLIKQYKSIRSRLRYALRQMGSSREARTIRESLQAGLERVIEELIGESAKGLNSALGSGIVELHFFDIKSRKVAEEYFSVVADAVVSGTTYPLLDEPTGDLISSAIAEGKVVPLGASVDRAKQVGLPSSLFARLPLFDKASIDEIVDIRSELHSSLTRFRSAMVRFSREIESAPWNREFPLEVERIYYEYVEPAILEIEEAFRSNNLLLALITKPIKTPDMWLAGLGLLLDAQYGGGSLPDLLGKALIAGGVTSSAVKVVKEWRERNEEVQKNQLYFYYKIGESLTTSR